MLLTYEQQLALKRSELAVAKYNGDLVTFKYHRKVMYDYLWKVHPELLECRGHTYDATTGQLVLAAPTKSFNYLEDGYWKDVPLDTPVKLYKKYNGFMATVGVYKGEVIVGTTGTTNSDYVKMAREQIFKTWPMHCIKEWGEDYTWLFEIIRPDDPHIVQETNGAKYLGGRDNTTGIFRPVAHDISEYYKNITLEEALKIVADVRHEGFMCYADDNTGRVCKLKSPYYIGKKKLMRASAKAVEVMYNDTFQFNEALCALAGDMWDGIADEIKATVTQEEWTAKTEQERRLWIENLDANY